MTKGRSTIHTDPSRMSVDAPRDALLVEFGRRIQRHMVQKGWNQSELARRANDHMTGESKMSRDNISKYLNGQSMPSPVRLNALAKTFDTTPDELLPSRGVTQGSEKVPAFDMRDVGEGQVWLRVNQQVEWSKALKIMEILKGDE